MSLGCSSCNGTGGRGTGGAAYPTWSLLETSGFAAIGLLAIAIAVPVTDRRRPS